MGGVRASHGSDAAGVDAGRGGRAGGSLRRHRILAAFVAGVLLTLGALAVAGWFVLADQRRSGRLLAATISRALAREVRIERVTDLAPGRVVARGVALPRAGGWPADVAAESIEATGALVAAARGEAAPVRLTITRPVVAPVTGDGVGGLGSLVGLAEMVRGALAAPAVLDVTVTDGVLAAPGGAEGVTFRLTLGKAPGLARAEVTLAGRAGGPLALAADARVDGDRVRARLTGRGPLAALGGWLPAPALARESLDLRLDLDVGPAADVVARGHLAAGSVATVGGEASLRDGLLRVAGGRAELELVLGAALAGLSGQPSGRIGLEDVALEWRPDAGGWPSATGRLAMPRAAVSADLLGTPLDVEAVTGRLALEPAGSSAVVTGDVRIGRLRAAGVTAGPVEGTVRIVAARGGSLTGVAVDPLAALVSGVPFRGRLAWDGGRRRLDARAEARGAELTPLLRALGPGWPGPDARLSMASLQVSADGLDPAALDAGALRVDSRGLRLRQPGGELAAARAVAEARLEPGGASLSAEVEEVQSGMAALPGTLPRVAAAGRLRRVPGSPAGFEVERASVVARDARGAELATGELAPASALPRGATLSLRLPALERLAGLWPGTVRRISGRATLDLALLDGPRVVDGRLRAEVPEAELSAGRLALRGLVADLPVRRGAAGLPVPAPGRVEVAELAGFGLVTHDVTASASLADERLRLSELRHALYAGEGRGWLEMGWEAGGPVVRGRLTGEGVRVEEFVAGYGIRGGTMTGLLAYELDVAYRAGRAAADGRLAIPAGGTVTIELLDRLLAYAGADPTGVARRALENLRTFEYRSAEASVRPAGEDLRVTLSLKGRPRLGIFPPRVREINVRDMPLGFLARQFPSP